MSPSVYSSVRMVRAEITQEEALVHVRCHLGLPFDTMAFFFLGAAHPHPICLHSQLLKIQLDSPELPDFSKDFSSSGRSETDAFAMPFLFVAFILSCVVSNYWKS